MSKPTDVSQDQERLLKEGWEYVKQHPEMIDKLLAIFRSSDSRDISPDEDRQVDAILEEVKKDAQQGSRDLSSANVSTEDQERVAVGAVIAAGHTAYKIYQNPQVKQVVNTVAKKAWKKISSWF